MHSVYRCLLIIVLSLLRAHLGYLVTQGKFLKMNLNAENTCVNEALDKILLLDGSVSESWRMLHIRDLMLTQRTLWFRLKQQGTFTMTPLLQETIL